MPLSPSILAELAAIVGPQDLLTSPEDLLVYAFDGTAALNQLPGCVVFVTSTAEVSSVLRLANRERIPVVTRGSGTGLSGGSLPVPGCIVLCTVVLTAPPAPAGARAARAPRPAREVRPRAAAGRAGAD